MAREKGRACSRVGTHPITTRPLSLLVYPSLIGLCMHLGFIDKKTKVKNMIEIIFENWKY